MKLLLTSGGVTNDATRDALVGLLGKPIEDCDALCIVSAEYGHPWCTPQSAWRFVSGSHPSSLVNLGWRSMGLLELTALPSMGSDRWVEWVRAADALLVDGGEATYLAHWLRESGLAGLMPELQDTVWVGVSAGSMVMTPRIGPDFLGWSGAGGDDRALGVVDFSIFPHVGHPDMPENTMEEAERWATAIGGPAYALDEQSAIVVADGRTEVVSEGVWRHFPG
jgi:dipeptidase E